MGSSIGSCKQSLQDVRPSPVGPGKDLLSSNERRSTLTTPNGTLRNCVVSGANWPLATTRDLRLAGSIFFSALELSDRQASLSWALRAATSLAIAEKSAERKEAAWRTLQATRAKFREGLETVDLRLAKQVLNGSYRRDSAINSLH